MAKKAYDKRKTAAILSIIFGIIILVKPDLLALLVGIYLVVSGLANLL